MHSSSLFYSPSSSSSAVPSSLRNFLFQQASISLSSAWPAVLLPSLLPSSSSSSSSFSSFALFFFTLWTSSPLKCRSFFLFVFSSSSSSSSSSASLPSSSSPSSPPSCISPFSFSSSSVLRAEGGLTFSLEVCEESTLETLRALIEVETGIPPQQQLLFVDMKPINAAAATVGAAGIPDGSLILVTRAAAARDAASAVGSSGSSGGNAAAREPSHAAAAAAGRRGEGRGERAAAGRAPASNSRGGSSSTGVGSYFPDMRSLFDFSNIVVKDGRATTAAPSSPSGRAAAGGRGGAQQSRGGGPRGRQQQQQHEPQASRESAGVGAAAAAASSGGSSSSSFCSRGAGRGREGGGEERQQQANSAFADEEYLQQQAETLVNVCTADASTMAVLVTENEALAAVLPDAVQEAKRQSGSKVAFEKLKEYLRKQLQERRKAEEARVQALNEALADPLSAKAQTFMMQQIQAQQVEDNYLLAQEHLPEAFGHVFMLYVPIEINGVAVKAFVDSGAQGTFMSQSCAQRCNLTRLMDTRYQGTALGVGKAQILGRIHLATLKIGQRFYPSSFTVLQDEKIPFLLGLDLLRRYQCCIDLKKNVLRIDDDEVPFLGEKDIDKDAFGGERSALEETQDGGQTASGTASSSSSDPSAVGPTPPLQLQQQKQEDAATAAPPLRSQSSTTTLSSQDEAKVQQLVDLGFFRTDAVDALSQAGGNVEAAASFLLHQQQRVHRGSI